MKVGSLVRQRLFNVDLNSCDGGELFRYGVLFKLADDSLELGFGWVFWQLDKDGPYAVSNESYCEPAFFNNLELVALPN